MASTNEPRRDRLSTMPSETIQHIASYLYASHDPDKAHHRSPLDISPSFPNDLPNLALTSKLLDQQTNSWAHHFLNLHRAITKYAGYQTPNILSKSRPLRLLVRWSNLNCAFCGRLSHFSAILMNGLRCCAVCDSEQWPDKITGVDALIKYKLEEHQLLPNRRFNLLALHWPVPLLRYGTYYSAGRLVTMLLRKDVEALAKVAHGDLGAHLRQRREGRESKRLKKEGDAAETGPLGAVVDFGQMGAGQVIVMDDGDDDKLDEMRQAEMDAMFTEPILFIDE